MELRWLLYAFHLLDFGQDFVQQMSCVEQFECATSLALNEQFWSVRRGRARG